jgi:hypothetical protein
MTNLNCQIDLQGYSAQKLLTVGDKFVLECDGPLGLPFKDNVRFLLKDDSQYIIHKLQMPESTETHFKFIVTSYRTGEHKDIALVLSDGVTTATTNPLSWTVSSILKPGEEQKMVPSQGPFLLSYPLSLWLTLAAVVLGIMGLIGFVVYRRRQRKLMKAQLEKFTTMLPPFSQFSKDMRQTIKKLDDPKAEVMAKDIVVKMNEDLRLYLVRELMVPAHEYSDSAVLKEIRRDHRDLYDFCRADLKKVLSEFTKATAHLDKVSARDCEDLSVLSRKMAEKIYEQRKKVKSK